MTKKIEFKSDLGVELINVSASDQSVVDAARVSTGSESQENRGLINFLVKNRHGSPFEHNSFTFKVSAPIFVAREFMRHRIGFSYNEESGRYKELEPVFYVPPAHRPLVQRGKAGHYEFVDGNETQYRLVGFAVTNSCEVAYRQYESMLRSGIAREVARIVLPVNIYTSFFVTCNARSLMSFLSLRTSSNEGQKFPSFPMNEIEQVARKMEEAFKENMPLTYLSYVENGYVAPQVYSIG